MLAIVTLTITNMKVFLFVLLAMTIILSVGVESAPNADPEAEPFTSLLFDIPKIVKQANISREEFLPFFLG